MLFYAFRIGASCWKFSHKQARTVPDFLNGFTVEMNNSALSARLTCLDTQGLIVPHVRSACQTQTEGRNDRAPPNLLLDLFFFLAITLLGDKSREGGGGRIIYHPEDFFHNCGGTNERKHGSSSHRRIPSKY